MLEFVKADKSAVDEIRINVFCDEQGYPKDNLFDEHENEAEYISVVNDGKCIGCGRYFKMTSDEYHIDNIAIEKDYRKNGTGSALVEKLVEECKKLGAMKVTVNAESYAVGFYEKSGFAVNGIEFCDENLKRIPMVISFEFDGCSWVGCKEENDAFLARKTFSVENCKKAMLRVSALGFIKPYINGDLVTDELFIPAWSNYEKCDLTHASYPIFDSMTQRIYYLEYDVTDKIKDGKNVFSAHVGNGWYGQAENLAEGMPGWGANKLIFKLIITDDDGNETEICSDTSVKCKNSFIKRTNIYINETIDGREIDNDVNLISFDDSAWDNAVEEYKPLSVMEKQTFSGDKVAYSITPKLLSENGDEKLYDLRKDISGFWIIRFDDDAAPGDTVHVSIAEAMDKDKNFLLRHTGGEGRLQRDTYIYGGEDLEYYPAFTWRAGRFIKVEGKGKLVRFDVVYSPVKETSEFKSGNATLDWFYRAYVDTQNCNIHTMTPSDCPHRERLGYTGDGQLCCGAGMTLFDSEAMYRKWMQDIADCQDLHNGHVQHTAPYYGGGGGPGGWGGAIVIVPWTFYKKFGDKEVLKKYYHNMYMYLEYMASHSENNIVVREEEFGWCLGDWCPPNNDIKIPCEFVNTYFYLKCLKYTQNSAKILGYTDDVRKLEKRIQVVTFAFVHEFFDKSTGSFCDGVQGADAFGVDLGLGDERTILNIVNKYSELGQYDTGIFGTDILTRVLFEKGYGELAFELLTNEKESSYYNMKKHGATTLWENWDGCDSLCHPMFGAVSEYLFTYILGIKQTEDSTGYKKIKIEPADIPQLPDVSGSIMTKNGRISVEISTVDGVRGIKTNLPDSVEICD